MKVVELKNLTKHFDGVKAVNNLSLGIEAGSITSIIGPNGSGKTTLVNLLSGMLPIDGGLIVVGGQGLRKWSADRVASFGITRTFQDVRLFNQMSVLDNILVVLTQRKVFSALFEFANSGYLKSAEAILRKVGLWEKRGELAINLSYGQRKLLEIARALSMPAKIFLLDEPFAGLFPEMVQISTNLLLELKQAGKTIVLIEHNMELVRSLSDHIFVMDSGELLAQGSPEAVLAKREVVEAYLGE